MLLGPLAEVLQPPVQSSQPGCLCDRKDLPDANAAPGWAGGGVGGNNPVLSILGTTMQVRT